MDLQKIKLDRKKITSDLMWFRVQFLRVKKDGVFRYKTFWWEKHGEDRAQVILRSNRGFISYGQSQFMLYNCQIMTTAENLKDLDVYHQDIRKLSENLNKNIGKE